MLRTTLALIIGLTLVHSTVLAETREEKASRLIKQLDAKEASARAAAAGELGKLAEIKSSLGKPAVKRLVELLKDSDASVRAAAAGAVCRCDEPKTTVTPLVALLKEEKEQIVKVAAINGLGVMGESAREALTIIREIGQEARKEKNNRVAQVAQVAQQQISGRGKKN